MTGGQGVVLSEIRDPAARSEFIERALARQRTWTRRPPGLVSSGTVPPAVSKGRVSNATPTKTLTASVSAAPQPVARVDVKQWRAAVSDLPTALHEAAHAAISVLCGAEVDRAEVFPPGVTLPDGARGYCRYMPFGIETEQRKPLIWAAGAVAEAVLLHGRAPTRAQVDALLAVHGTDGEELQRLAFAAGTVPDPLAVLPLVLRAWPAISKLAVKLDIAGVIHHSDVTAALGLSKDKGLHGFELANIRAGLRYVPGKRSP